MKSIVAAMLATRRTPEVAIKVPAVARHKMSTTLCLAMNLQVSIAPETQEWVLMARNVRVKRGLARVRGPCRTDASHARAQPSSD
jgi:hypothetical protein